MIRARAYVSHSEPGFRSPIYLTDPSSLFLMPSLHEYDISQARSSIMTSAAAIEALDAAIADLVLEGAD